MFMKRMTLSVVMLTKNSDEVLEEALKSVASLASEILASDESSKDNTRFILRHFDATILPAGRLNPRQTPGHGLSWKE